MEVDETPQFAELAMKIQGEYFDHESGETLGLFFELIFPNVGEDHTVIFRFFLACLQVTGQIGA